MYIEDVAAIARDSELTIEEAKSPTRDIFRGGRKGDRPARRVDSSRGHIGSLCRPFREDLARKMVGGSGDSDSEGGDDITKCETGRVTVVTGHQTVLLYTPPM